MRRLQVAADEAKEDIGSLVNKALVGFITEVKFLDATMAGATKGNELFALALEKIQIGMGKVEDKADQLEGALIFAASKGALPLTEALVEQAQFMGLSEGQTRKLSDRIDALAKNNIIGRQRANEYMRALGGQADQMSATREDGRLLTDRYINLAGSTDRAKMKAKEYRLELANQRDELRKLIDPIFRLREAQRDYNEAFEEWSTLMVTGKANADELSLAEDRLISASLEVQDATADAAVGAHAMREGWNAAAAAAGILEGATWESKEAIDQWSQAVRNAPRWNPGGPTGGPTPFARGGRFRAGMPMLVGERGPEVILPNVGGTVVPNHQLTTGGGGMVGAGGGTLTINVMVDKRVLAQAVVDANEYNRRRGV
jgi:hypothetical protein